MPIFHDLTVMTERMSMKPIYLCLGIPWGTQETRSPRNPALFSLPDPRGMNFIIPRLPELPAIIPRVTRL